MKIKTGHIGGLSLKQAFQRLYELINEKWIEDILNYLKDDTTIGVLEYDKGIWGTKQITIV